MSLSAPGPLQETLSGIGRVFGRVQRTRFVGVLVLGSKLCRVVKGRPAQARIGQESGRSRVTACLRECRRGSRAWPDAVGDLVSVKHVSEDGLWRSSVEPVATTAAAETSRQTRLRVRLDRSLLE